MNNLIKITLTFSLFLSSLSFGQSIDCASMDAICTDAGLDFVAQTGITAASTTDPGNNYGCLGTTPNPTWYFLEIDTDGDLVMLLSAPNDIDFILYGPYVEDVAGGLTALEVAQADCGTMGQAGGAPIVDCSYNSTNQETVEVSPNSSGGATTAVVGEVYVLLITNFNNSIQPITLTQTGGNATTDCSIVIPCVSNPGTFTRKKDGVITAFPLYLCEGESFSIESNADYVLPNDTVVGPLVAPFGDGIFTSQLMWLVYDAAPTGNDPNADPNYTGSPGYAGAYTGVNIIPSDSLYGTHSPTDPFFQSLGGVCGEFYLVPVAGDDGIGDGGANDNNNVTWDKNDNGCYLLGNYIRVTFACPIETTPTIACGPPNGNAMDVEITGGSGSYTIINQGVGNLSGTTIANGGTVSISNLNNNTSSSYWNIDIEDNKGCTATVQGAFDAPTIVTSTMTPATACPLGVAGDISVTIGATGTGALAVTMNGTPTTGTPFIFAGLAGVLVNTIVTDANGCTVQDNNTIGSLGHFIENTVNSITGENCYGDGNGSYDFTPTGVSAPGVPDGTQITSVNWEWTEPGTGITTMVYTTAAPNLLTSQTGLAVGTWNIYVTDASGCDVAFSFEITGPQELDLYITTSNHITCFGGFNGTIVLDVNGGVFGSAPGTSNYGWDTANPTGPDATDVNGNETNNALAGDYTAWIVDDNGCVDTVRIELTQPGELTAWETIKPINCYGDATGVIIIDSVTNGVGTIDYKWDLNPVTQSNVYGDLVAGTYNLQIKDQNGCLNNHVYVVTEADELIISLSVFQSALCRSPLKAFNDGKGQVSATISGGGLSDGNGNIDGTTYNYFWTSLETGSTNTNTTFGNLNPGLYTFEVENDLGCITKDTILLDSISPIAAFTLTSPDFTSDFEGDAIVNIQLTNESQNYAFENNPFYGPEVGLDTLFIWTMGHADGSYDTIAHDIDGVLSVPYTEEGVYEVCLKVRENLFHCEDSICQTIVVHDVPSLIVPNVFTPDGDGANDNFFFPNVGIIEFECIFFDRWGTEVYKFTDINNTWDGKNSGGTECVDGVYFYSYKGQSTNGTKYKGQGDLQIVRGK